MHSRSILLFVGICGMLLLPTTARAQGAIAGAVVDESGGVLPGVTVVAASPVLIEQERTAVTNGAGLYNIVDLRPGAYTVTFGLGGFSSVVREGIELSGSFVANVDATMVIGSVEETITVSGASPVVDVQSTIVEEVLTKERIAILPGSRTIKGRAALIPGVVVPGGNTGAVAHGSDSQDSHTMVDGYKAGQHLVGRGTGQLGVGSVTQTTEAAVEELVYDVGSQGAEYAFSGVRMNMIPKEGSNRFSAEFIGYGSNQNFEKDNQNQALKDDGFVYAPQLFAWDFNGVAGGPIQENKLWWFGSFAGSRSDTQVLDTFYKEGNPNTPEGKGGELATTGAHFNDSETIRVTHQVSSRDKLRYSYDRTVLVNPRGNFGRGVQPEAAWQLILDPTWLAQVKYTSAVSTRVLIEAGFSYQRGDFEVNFQPENGPGLIADWDLVTGIVQENHYISYLNTEKKKEFKASVSYVTGSHNIKVGFENRWATGYQRNPYNGDMQYRFTLAGAPFLVGVTNGLGANVQALHWDGGLFVQDSWTIDRLTLNLGARYDKFDAGILANDRPAGYFVDALSVPEIANTPSWNNGSIRVGGAYDLAGNGRTAVKGFFGMYVAGEAFSKTARFNPIYSQTDTRPWTDLNGDNTVINPDGTPQFAEIGPSNNPGFGGLAGTDVLDPNLPREKNVQYTLSLEQEIRPGWSMTGSYFRRRYYDQDWSDNLALSAADYQPFTFTGPADARFPAGGGELITAYNLDPSKATLQGADFVTLSDNFRVYNGLEVTADLNLPAAGFVITSWGMGKQEVDSCTAGRLENPNQLRFCNTTSPWRHIFKLTGGIPIPGDLTISGDFQIYDTPGAGLGSTAAFIRANHVVSTLPDGTALTQQRETVNLIEPYELLVEYYKQFNMRITKDFIMSGGARYRVLAEFNNVLNAGATRTFEQNYGARWLRTEAIQRGRLIRLGTQLTF